jgi:hypothetical protein
MEFLRKECLQNRSNKGLEIGKKIKKAVLGCVFICKLRNGLNSPTSR